MRWKPLASSALGLVKRPYVGEPDRYGIHFCVCANRLWRIEGKTAYLIATPGNSVEGELPPLPEEVR